MYVIQDWKRPECSIKFTTQQEVYKMPKRTRTIQWEDPQISSRDTQNISGLDYLCATSTCLIIKI